MQKVHTGIPNLTLGSGKSNNNIYSLLIPPIQQQQQDNLMLNWNLPKPSPPNNNSNSSNNNNNNKISGHLDKKIKLSIKEDEIVNTSNKFNQQQNIDSSMDEDEDQTLPNFKQFELNIDGGKSNSLQNLLSKAPLSSPSSTSSSPSHEPTFSTTGQNSTKDFRLGYSPFVCDSTTSSHSPYSSYPSSPIDQNNLSSCSSSHLSRSNQMYCERKQIQDWVQELQSLRKRETILLENLKNYSASDDSDEEQCYSPSLVNTSSLSSTPNNQPNNQPSISSLFSIINNNKNTSNNNNETILVQQQPPENIIFNRYINPSPILLIDQEVINKCTGYLIVNASLIHRPTSTTKPINRVSIKGNQDLLQGVKSIIVEKSGVVLFNKLKVNDSGFKYQNQYFNLYFTLSEISSDNQIHTISQIITSPFQFTTRYNNNINNNVANNTTLKRKFEEIDSDSQEPSSPHSKNSPICSSPYSPPSPLISNEQQQQPQQTQQSLQLALMNSSSSTSSSCLITNSNNSINNNGSDSNYIDITDLLVLPQKEAAARLGISESMLCKRFKECTKRKWPYRYLKKIDKVIKILSFQNINEMPKEEKDKLEKFTIEREECLRPVKIRITGCLEKEDFDFSNHTSNPCSSINQSVGSTANLIIGYINNQQPNQDIKQQQQQSSITSNTSKSQIQNIINGGNVPSSQNDIVQAPKVSSKMFESFTNGGESNGLENLLETLEMLKHTH